MVVVIANDARVAVAFVDRVGADDARIAPRDVAMPAGQIGRDIREAAIGVLRIGVEIDEPLGEERCDVEVVRGGGDEELRIAGPAEALIALRAVGGDFEVVALLAPDDVVEQLVHRFVGAIRNSRCAACRRARRCR